MKINLNFEWWHIPLALACIVFPPFGFLVVLFIVIVAFSTLLDLKEAEEKKQKEKQTMADFIYQRLSDKD